MIDLDEARRFLSLLDPDAQTFTFQTVGEGKRKGDGSLSRILHGSLDSLAKELRSLNEAGAGIFVTVNETDGQGRAAENITRIRAVWQDDDKGFKGEYALDPSIVVKTSLGKYHRYWLVNGELRRAFFAPIMNRMAESYGCDKSAKDVARVLRVPGFVHNKGKPSIVKIIGGDGRRYDPAQLIKAFRGFPQGNSAPMAPPRATPAAPRQPDFAPAPIEWQDEKERIRSALKFVPSDLRDTWFKFGAAVYDASGGSEEGFAIWDEWSKQTKANNYDPDEQHQYWTKEFKRQSRDKTTIASIYAEARTNGWTASADETHAGEPLERPTTSYDHPTRHTDGFIRVLGRPPQITKDEIASKALAGVRSKFETYAHRPSEQHWKGLLQIARVFERMAVHLQAPVFSVSFLSAGMGKTTTLVECVKALVAERKYWPVGVIIFLSRLEEIRKLASEMRLSNDDYAVLVSDGKEENRLGRQVDKTKARVIFTTQAGLEARSRNGRRFADMTELFYRGKPRQVRVWDEAILPSKIHTVSRHSLGVLVGRLSNNGYEDATRRLDEFCRVLDKSKTNAIVTVPRIGVDFDEFATLLDHPRDQQTVEALRELQGRSVRVKNDHSGNTVLDYDDILPTDLAPMLILDASGQQRHTYHLWCKGRRNLEFLRSPQKKYEGFTIHHWNKGAGKIAQGRGEWRDIADGVAKTINEDIPADEAVLIVHFKKNARIPDMEYELVNRIQGDTSRIKFCNWGRETATNDYALIKYVFLAGVPYYHPAQYEAAARGALGLKTTDHSTWNDFFETRMGEVAHRILQAANRGMVRRTEGTGCAPGCHLYVVFSSREGKGVRRSLLTRIFPGSSVVEWKPISDPTGRLKQLVDILDQQPNRKIVTLRHLADEMGIADVSNVRRLLNHPAFAGAIAARKIEVERLRGKVQIRRLGGPAVGTS